MFRVFSFRFCALFALGAVAYTTTQPVAAALTREFDAVFEASPDHTLVVDAIDAELTITASDRSDIALHMVWSTDEDAPAAADKVFDRLAFQPKVSAHRTALVLKRQKTGGWFSRHSGETPHVRMELTVPAALRVQVDLTAGTVALAGVNGDHRIDTTSAAVRLEGCAGNHRIDTTSGPITLRGSPGNHHLDSTSGSILVEGGAGNVHADTTSGDIVIRDFPGAHRADSTSGRIEASLAEVIGRPLRFDSMSGDIRLTVPPGLAARYELETMSGQLTFAVDGGEVTRRERDELAARTGTGEGPRIVLETMSGDITVTSR